MRRVLLDVLRDPISMEELSAPDDREELTDSELRSPSGRCYPVVAGIPRFVVTEDAGQLQTQAAFDYKWKHVDSYKFLRQPGEDAVYSEWLSEKYGFAGAAEWRAAFDTGGRVLDLGCGAGMASYFWLRSPEWSGHTAWVGVDISGAVDVARELLRDVPGTDLVQADALQLPFADGAFDAILSEGVLHHTPSTERALQSATRVLAPGGTIHFYVYRRKSPVREFTDDHVRRAIASVSDAEAWAAMRPLTQLAHALSDLRGEIELEEPIPELGIPAGRHDVQRLIYWNFAKLYWNDRLDFEENVHVNFDWYRPTYAHRQTEEEVRGWCEAVGLEVTRLHVQESGYTVRAVRRR